MTSPRPQPSPDRAGAGLRLPKHLPGLFGLVGLVDRLERALTPPLPPLAPSRALPSALIEKRYRLERILGVGGMGRVWLAHDELAGRQVALKEIRLADQAPGAALELAFKREFYTMTKLVHPNTLKVFDYGTIDANHKFLTMEVVPGEDLRERIERGPFAEKDVVDVLTSMAQVLGFIHSRYYVHCDIKSSNIRVTPQGIVKLMDFGLMHQLGLPSEHSLKGTPHYMAPEIPRGGAIDARTDLYSLGILAFEMATGRFPFDGSSLTEIIAAHLHQPLPPWPDGVDLSPGLRAVVTRLLSKEPRERYPSAGDFLQALATCTGRRLGTTPYSVRVSYLNCAELIGREPEQKALQSALAALEAGQSQSHFITAPPGVGKTRLLQEFRLGCQLRDVPFSVGQCRAEGQAPLTPLVEALAPLLARTPKPFVEANQETLARFFPSLRRPDDSIPGSHDPVATKLKNFDVLGRWIKEVSSATPFILCFEDLQWADAATIEYVNVVIRAAHESRGMVLGTFRSNEVDRLSSLFQTVDAGLTTRLELSPLSKDGVARLVTTMLGEQSVSPALIERLFEATRGNAFFVTETLRAFVEQGTLGFNNGVWQLSVPASDVELFPDIGSAVGSRLKSLPEELHGLCQRLAPIGRLLELPVLRAVGALPEDALFGALDELVERQFIQRHEEHFYFSHDTVRDAVYQLTPELERRSAHQAIAEALEATGKHSPGVLGYHFSRGDDRIKAIRYLLEDSAEAQAANLYLRTVQQMAQAADLVEAGDYPRKINTLIGLWAKLIEMGCTAHPPTCIRYADKLFALWDKRLDLKAGAKAFGVEAESLSTAPRWFRQKKARALWGEQPLDADSRDPLHVVPKLYAFRALQSVALSSVGEDARVLDIAARQSDDNPRPGPYRATAFSCRGVYLLHTGQLRELQANATLALDWYQAHLTTIGILPRLLWRDYAMNHHFLILALAMSGQPLDAAVLERGLALSSEHRFSEVSWFLRAGEGVRAAFVGDPAPMHASYDLLVDMSRRMGNPQMADSRLGIWVGPYWLQRHEREQSEAVVMKVEEWKRRLPNDHWLTRYSAALRALFETQFGTQDVARLAVENALAAASTVDSFRLNAQLHVAQARLEARANRLDDARASAARALKLATDAALGSPIDETVARRVDAEVRSGAAGLHQAREAIDVARRHGLLLHEGLGHLAAWRVARALAEAGAAFHETCGRDLLTRLAATDLLKVELDRTTALGSGAGGT